MLILDTSYIYGLITLRNQPALGPTFCNVQDLSLMNFSASLNGQKLTISAVDKRSTTIVTPCLSVKRLDFSGKVQEMETYGVSMFSLGG